MVQLISVVCVKRQYESKDPTDGKNESKGSFSRRCLYTQFWIEAADVKQYPDDEDGDCLTELVAECHSTDVESLASSSRMILLDIDCIVDHGIWQCQQTSTTDSCNGCEYEQIIRMHADIAFCKDESKENRHATTPVTVAKSAAFLLSTFWSTRSKRAVK